MNRELKFRAWDKEIKHWLWPYPEGFHIIGEVTVNDMLKPYSIEDFNNIEIVEYTGLKDKNGKEIYENDIIKIKCNNELIINKTVKFENGAFGISGYYLSTVLHESEIIGNFFEDKYLLK